MFCGVKLVKEMEKREETRDVVERLRLCCNAVKPEEEEGSEGRSVFRGGARMP